MGYLAPDDSGAAAYDVLESATIAARTAKEAMGSVTAARPLGLLDLILPPLAFLRAGSQFNADLRTGAARTAATNRLADLELALGNACEEAARLDAAAIGDDNATRWNALLEQAAAAGATVGAEVQRARAAGAPLERALDAPGTALEGLAAGAGSAVRGVGTAGAGALGVVGWLGRNLGWLLLGAAVVGIGVLFLLKLPQRWIARAKKGA